MKVIFLDIDGVLNDDTFLLKAHSKSVFERDEDEIDPSKVALLNQIIDRTGAKVVISSSWRIIIKLTEMRRLLAFHGFHGEVISLTPSIQRPGRIRGDEIQKWFDDYGCQVSHFVILDDDDDMGALSPYLVRTSAATGLTERDVESAVWLLGRS